MSLSSLRDDVLTPTQYLPVERRRNPGTIIVPGFFLGSQNQSFGKPLLAATPNPALCCAGFSSSTECPLTLSLQWGWAPPSARGCAGDWVTFNPVIPALPLGTLASNLIGGYLIGVAIEYFAQHGGLSAEARLFIITGFLGGLTTFSTFSAEAVTLLARSQFGWATLLISGHLVGSLAMTVLGIATAKWLST